MVLEGVFPVSEAQFDPQIFAVKLYGPDGRVE